MSNQITGFFLSFSDEEMNDVKRRLELFGYKPDGEGLKKLVVESLCDMEEGEEEPASPTDAVIGHVRDYLEKNPEQVMMGIAAVKGLANMLKRKR